MKYEALKEELFKAYMDYYAEGFKTSDLSLIDKIVKYPIAYIKDGSVDFFTEYPIDPKKLKADTGWDHSTDWKFEITAINERDAHATASAVRRRKDGSKIESVHGFYAFTMTDDGWKMYAVADNTF